MLLTVDEVARALRCPRDSVYRRIHDGQLEAVRVGATRPLPGSRLSGGASSAHKDAFDAWYVERTGDVTFLQRPASGPKTLDELEAQRAEKQQRSATV